MTRVVLLSLDAFVPHALNPVLTPRMWALAQQGGFAPQGGIVPLPSVTYPAHASLLTGCLPTRHGVRTGRSGGLLEGVVPGWGGQPQVTVPTLFDACRDAGLRSVAVCGDHKLVTILRASSASSAWPASGEPLAGIDLDLFGYATNAATAEVMRVAITGDADFFFGHLNETDTIGHLYGPDAAETWAADMETDTIVGELTDHLRDLWDETVVFIVSDHGTALLPDSTIDLAAAHPAIAATIDEAGFALVRLRDGADEADIAETIRRLDGVTGVAVDSPGILAVTARPGVIFGAGTPKAIRAGHGGPETERTLAIVAGGHPTVERLAASFATTPPRLIDLAPTIASLLGLTLSAVDGSDLLG